MIDNDNELNIIVLDRCTLTVGDINFDSINRLGNVKYFDILTKDEIIKVAENADVIICNKSAIDREIIEKCRALKYVGLLATGYNNIDLEAAGEYGVYVTNAPAYSTVSVAQHIFAFILYYASNMEKYNSSTHDGDWTRVNTFSYFPYPIMELDKKILGIVGFGSIGKEVAKIGEAFGMRILFSTRTVPKKSKYEFVSKEELFKRADYISLNCPLTNETKGMVNYDLLSTMKKSAFFVNTSRGPVVVEEDLQKALNEGLLAGAGVDVLSNEPMEAGNPLLTAKNCIITPHIAWASYEARQRLIELVAQNIKAYIDGKPKNVVNKLFFGTLR